MKRIMFSQNMIWKLNQDILQRNRNIWMQHISVGITKNWEKAVLGSDNEVLQMIICQPVQFISVKNICEDTNEHRFAQIENVWRQTEKHIHIHKAELITHTVNCSLV